MSIIKANTFQDRGGNVLLSSDGSGTISSGGAITNTPAFEAYLSSDQSVSSDAWTKVEIDTEVFDSNNNFDNSTNYRFTPTVAGKYHIFGGVTLDADASNLSEAYLAIYKNGSVFYRSFFALSNRQNEFSLSVVTTVEANGTADYFELYARCTDTSGNPTFKSVNRQTRFGAYRIIGA